MPGSTLKAGAVVTLRVVLEPPRSDAIHWFAIRQRADVLDESPRANAQQIAQLQQEVIRLKRIVGNLISNAVRYTQKGGILVASRVTPRGRRIEIWDTGVGIAPVHQREIFREFYKVPSHAGTEEGFGLGLYIVARLTQILGHPLTLASRPGRGTVFRLMVVPTDPEAAGQRAHASVAQLTHWDEATRSKIGVSP